MGSFHLIVGLGNPTAQYAGTRHNIGFMVIDRLAQRHRLSPTAAKFKGLWDKGILTSREDVALLKPQTYMNVSGDSVQPAASYFDVAPHEIIVVHDELDLDAGTVRIKKGGGHGGHNGLRDIIAKLGSRDFIRVRMGIGRPSRGSVTDWVLGTFASNEQDIRDEMIERGCDAIEMIVSDGVIAAQNHIHAS